jgi:hypothetical protein
MRRAGRQIGATMKLKSVFAAATVLIVTACTANASVVEVVDMTFSTGATFSGTVTFADDFSSVSNVNGVLTGYQFGDPTYSSGFSDAINFVSTFPPFTASGTFGTYLLDAPDTPDPNAYSHFIVFTYDFSGAPTLAFSSDGSGNSIDFLDPFVSGSIRSGSVGVPGPVAGAGLPGLLFVIGGLLILRRSHRAKRSFAAIAAA